MPEKAYYSKNFNFFETIAQNIYEKPVILSNNKDLVTLFYYLTSVTDKELFSFIKSFFLKYDEDRLFMLDFEQFKVFFQSMTKRFGVDKMSDYFSYLDKFNYHQCEQKDRLFSKKIGETNYFGPFVMQVIFERFKGDLPTDLGDRVEFLTDFWKFLPCVFNMMFMRALADIKKKREEYHV